MAVFFATMAYELGPETELDARKLLRAELVGRRWLDRQQGDLMPASSVWIRRAAADHETTDDVHRACGNDLSDAVHAVQVTGRSIRLVRAWVQVAGSGTYGLLSVPPAPG